MRCVPRFTRGIGRLGVGDKSLNIVHVHVCDREVTAFIASRVSTFAAVEMALAVLTLEKFASAGQLDTFRNGLVCLEFHKWELTLGFATDDGGDVAAAATDRLFHIQRIRIFEGAKEAEDALLCDFSMLLLASAEIDLDFEFMAFS